ncbi:unnamed protein product, partial [Allacma fusca]
VNRVNKLPISSTVIPAVVTDAVRGKLTTATSHDVEDIMKKWLSNA